MICNKKNTDVKYYSEMKPEAHMSLNHLNMLIWACVTKHIILIMKKKV